MRSGPVVLGFAAFAIVLDRWPEYIGDPTRIRQWAEYLCYAMIAVGHRHRLGPRRHAHPRSGCVLRARRVLDGHVPVARAGSRRRDAGVHVALQRLQDAAVAVAAVQAPVVRRAGGRARSRCSSPPASGGSSSTDGSAAPYFAILTQATALVFWLLARRPAPAHRRHQRSHQLLDGVRPEQVRAGHQRVPVRPRRGRAVRHAGDRAPGGEEPLRPAARRHPRRRGPRALPRLRPRGHEDVRVRGVGGHGRARRRAQRADHRHRRDRTSSRCCRRSSWSRGSRSADARRSTAR